MFINKIICDEKKYPYVDSLSLIISHLNLNIYWCEFFKNTFSMIREIKNEKMKNQIIYKKQCISIQNSNPKVGSFRVLEERVNKKPDSSKALRIRSVILGKRNFVKFLTWYAIYFHISFSQAHHPTLHRHITSTKNVNRDLHCFW